MKDGVYFKKGLNSQKESQEQNGPEQQSKERSIIRKQSKAQEETRTRTPTKTTTTTAAAHTNHFNGKLTGFLLSSSKGTAKELVASTCPLFTVPSKTPTTRLRVPLATRL